MITEETVKQYGNIEVVKVMNGETFIHYCLRQEGKFLYDCSFNQYAYPSLWIAELHAKDLLLFRQKELN